MADDKRAFVLKQCRPRTYPYTFYRALDGVETGGCIAGKHYTDDVRLARRYYGIDEAERHAKKGDRIIEITTRKGDGTCPH